MTIHSDQQVLSRQTLPEAMMESYDRCHPVPNLSLLTKYRHDGKDALKFYTDPSYFFELWKQKMNVEYEKRRRKKRREQRGKKRDTEKKVVKGVKKKELTKNIPDWEIQERKERSTSSTHVEPSPVHVDEFVSPTHSTGSGNTLSPRTSTVKRSSIASVIGRPATAPPPPPTTSPSKPPPPPPLYEGQPAAKGTAIPPPPPPPPPTVGQITPAIVKNDDVLESTSQRVAHKASMPSVPPVVTGPPPPPPPPPPGIPPTLSGVPPPPSPPAQPQISNADLTASIQNVVLSSPKPALPPPSDPRNDLLTAIREGMNLRKAVQITKEERQQGGMGNDVASILSRRIALELTDSEGDSEYSDEGEWSDD